MNHNQENQTKSRLLVLLTAVVLPCAFFLCGYFLYPELKETQNRRNSTGAEISHLSSDRDTKNAQTELDNSRNTEQTDVTQTSVLEIDLVTTDIVFTQTTATQTTSATTVMTSSSTTPTSFATTTKTTKTTTVTTMSTTRESWWSPPVSQTSAEFKIEDKTGTAKLYSGSELSNYSEYYLAFQEVITRDNWNSADLKYFLCDINSDEIPELFIAVFNYNIYRDEIFYVYALKDQAPIELWAGGGSGASGYSRLSVMKSGYLCHAASLGGYYTSVYYQYTGGTSLVEVESVTIHDDKYTWSSPKKKDQTITEEIYNQIEASYGDILY